MPRLACLKQAVHLMLLLLLLRTLAPSLSVRKPRQRVEGERRPCQSSTRMLEGSDNTRGLLFIQSGGEVAAVSVEVPVTRHLVQGHMLK